MNARKKTALCGGGFCFVGKISAYSAAGASSLAGALTDTITGLTLP